MRPIDAVISRGKIMFMIMLIPTLMAGPLTVSLAMMTLAYARQLETMYLKRLSMNAKHLSHSLISISRIQVP